MLTENQQLRAENEMLRHDGGVVLDDSNKLRARVAELEEVLAWARRAYVMLGEIERDGEWDMFNLLDDTPDAVKDGQHTSS